MADDGMDSLKDIDPAPTEETLLVLAALTGTAVAVEIDAFAIDGEEGLGAFFPGGAVGDGIVDVLGGGIV